MPFQDVGFIFLSYECFAYMYIYESHPFLVPKEARREVRFPGTRVIDSCESVGGCWKLSLSPQSSEAQ